MVRNYEKVRSYEKGTEGFRRGYEISFQVMKKVTTKVRSYERATSPIGIICYDVVMHYMKIKDIDNQC